MKLYENTNNNQLRVSEEERLAWTIPLTYSRRYFAWP